MNTTKRAVRLVAEVCRRKGIRKAVFSPGSRSAPLVIAFSQIPEIECIVIPDERVAGYFALGMAQQLGEPVAIICTSGTAVLNLSPPVCEAYYQNIPLIIITADRPEGAEARGENQAIMQEGIFGSYASFGSSINGDAHTDRDLEKIIGEVSASIDASLHSYPGPAHINVRMGEPLYDVSNEKHKFIDFGNIWVQPDSVFMELKDLHRIKNKFPGYEKKMLLVGMREKGVDFAEKIKKLSTRKDVIVLCENLANLSGDSTVQNIDSCLHAMDGRQLESFIPDVIITLGGKIVSKKIRNFLTDKAMIHWDIPPGETAGRNMRMFGDMLEPIEPCNETQFLDTILDTSENTESDFNNNWLGLSRKAHALTTQYVSQIEFSDLKAFDTLVKSFPDHAFIQYGNSTPVRYSNLFTHPDSLTVNGNRGTGGIDGCVSTAAGAAYSNNKLTVCVVGDVTFFYDSNALWSNYLSPDFRIIVINNSGGNIFRMLEGATNVRDFEKFFETTHHLTAKHLAAMYDLPYYFCDEQKELEKILKTFYGPQKGRTAILEIKTDNILSADIYKAYFEYLRQNR